MCLKCQNGYSLDGHLNCLNSMNGCRIFDDEKKRCLQCVFGWYMNSKYGCNKGRCHFFNHFQSVNMQRAELNI